MTTAVENLKVIVGSRPYLVIATKGDTLLGVHFGLYPTKDGGTGVLLSFAASDQNAEFNHLVVRGTSEYNVLDPETKTGHYSKGARLSRIPIPLFSQKIPVELIGKYAKEYNTFGRLGEWLRNLLLLEGFTPLFFNDEELFQKLFPALTTDLSEVHDALVLPELEDKLPNSGEIEEAESSESSTEEYDAEDEEEV